MVAGVTGARVGARAGERETESVRLNCMRLCLAVVTHDYCAQPPTFSDDAVTQLGASLTKPCDEIGACFNSLEGG